MAQYIDVDEYIRKRNSMRERINDSVDTPTEQYMSSMLSSGVSNADKA